MKPFYLITARFLIDANHEDLAENDTAIDTIMTHLPDFGEFEALDRAFAHAAAHPHRYIALRFLLAWPRLDLAAKLVLENTSAWDGRHYGALVPAAETLEETYPAEATVLYRALINYILARARSPAYGHAARYLTKLASLADQVEAWHDIPDHVAYHASLKQAHGRKAAFWSLVRS